MRYKLTGQCEVCDGKEEMTVYDLSSGTGWLRTVHEKATGHAFKGSFNIEYVEEEEKHV